MSLALELGLYGGLLTLLMCLYMLWRSDKVFDYRVDLLCMDYARYKRLPSRRVMLYRFWVWPLSRFEDRP